MNRTLKALGLASVAAIAAIAMAVSAAQATVEGEFVAGSYPASVHAIDDPEGTNAFTTSIGNVECNKATYTGSASGPSSTLTITPTYEECGTRTVKMNGCAYVFGVTKHVAENHWSGNVTVECEAGKQIEVLVYSDTEHKTQVCRITIGSQGPLSGITYTENPATGDINIEGTVEGIHHVLHGACVLGGTVTRTDATYHVDVNAEGTGGNSIGIETSGE